MGLRKKKQSDSKAKQSETKSEGCKACNNTGLQQDVALADAQLCEKCGGSPYGE